MKQMDLIDNQQPHLHKTHMHMGPSIQHTVQETLLTPLTHTVSNQ
jgi:hypothetical protein